MILDRLTNAEQYYSLNPHFKEVFEYIKTIDLVNCREHRLVLSDDVYINIDNPTLRPKCEATPEVHNKYIDIQIPLVGEEQVGVMSREDCHIVLRRDDEKDYIIYKELPENFFRLTPKDFVIFFPNDAHAPIVGEGTEKKIVVKIKVK